MTSEQPGRSDETPEATATPVSAGHEDDAPEAVVPADVVGTAATDAPDGGSAAASDAEGGDEAVDGDADASADADELARGSRGVDAPPVPSEEELPQRIEALLFVSDGGVEEGVLARALGVTRRRLDRALETLTDALREGDRGVRLQRGPDGAQLVTAPEAASYVEYFLGLESARRLSTAALETLAIIAYRHPVTRGTIEAIRGVSSDAAIATLRSRGLIADGGRAEGPGRPVLWVTTQRFLQHFGLERPDDLPPLPEELELPEESAGAQMPLGVPTADDDLAAFTQVAGATLAGYPAPAPAEEAGAEPPPAEALNELRTDDAAAPPDDRG